MKKFIALIATLFVVLAAIDTACGALLDRLTASATRGYTARNEFIADKLTSPVVIFGSSRAVHHYDPKTFRDSLNLDCYNAGQDGMGIILSYGRFRLMTARYTPKIIICDVTADFDLNQNDNTTYLTWLKPYYHRNAIDSIFWTVDPTMRIKMISQMFRYNGKLLQILTDNKPGSSNDDQLRGYVPLDGTMSYDTKEEAIKPVSVDSVKLSYLNRLAGECSQRGIKLFFTISPFYNSKSNSAQLHQALYAIAKKNGIPVLDHFSDKDIAFNKELFQDSYHMNHTGAEMFSRRIAHDIKQMLAN